MAKKKPAETTPAPPAYRNRIVGYKEIPASQIVDNPDNYRFHPQEQQEALRSQLEKMGIADACTVRPLPDGRYALINGHLRRKLINNVPCLITDLDENESLSHLLHVDAITSMAQAISEKRDLLIQRVTPTADIISVLNKMTPAPSQIVATAMATASNAPDVAELAQAVHTPIASDLAPSAPPLFNVAEVRNYDEETGESSQPTSEETNIYGLRSDVRFASSNRWGIPDLRADMLADVIPAEVWARQKPADIKRTMFLPGQMPPKELRPWSPITINDLKGSILGFYASDDYFEQWWADHVGQLEKMKQVGFAVALSPDFSAIWEFPLAVNLFQRYRANHLARYWQEAGIRIIPSLMWTGRKEDAPLMAAGLPANPPVVACQLRYHLNRKDANDTLKVEVARIAEVIEILKPANVVIYGDRHREKAESSLPGCAKYHWLEDWNKVRNRQGKGIGDKKEM